jgi:hypothetical protein
LWHSEGARAIGVCHLARRATKRLERSRAAPSYASLPSSKIASVIRVSPTPERESRDGRGSADRRPHGIVIIGRIAVIAAVIVSMDITGMIIPVIIMSVIDLLHWQGCSTLFTEGH